MISPLRAALRYAARGWPVFPLHTIGADARCTCGHLRIACPCARVPCAERCGKPWGLRGTRCPCGGWRMADRPAGEECDLGSKCAPGKHPRTSHGVRDATVDPDRIRAWWAITPSANVAIACGAPGPVVLDVDPRNGGPATLAQLVQQFGPLPPTLQVATGGAGLHYYLDGDTPSAKLGPGLDWQARGKYVVAPPSMHASGLHYAWASPRGTPFAPVPAWLSHLADPPPLPPAQPPRYPSSPASERLTRASRYLAAMPASVQGQDGSGTAMRAAVALVRGFELGERDAADLLAGKWNDRCRPPWSRREIGHKVKSASRSHLPPGYLLERP